MSRKTLGIFAVASLLNWAGWCDAEDWRQFRGEAGSSATTSTLPAEIGHDRGVAWKIELPGRAVNGPIVVGNQVIATSSSGPRQKRLHVYSIDDQTGEVRWHRRFWATGRTLCHPLSAVAAPTPSSDGERIFAFFSSNDLFCLDLEGNLLWSRALFVENENTFDDRGMASSTIVSGNTLVVQVACAGESFVAGINKNTGATKWKVPLSKDTNWATPANVRLFDNDLVMLQSADKLLLVTPDAGTIHHQHEAEGAYIPSPIFASDLVLMPADGMTAVRFSKGEEAGEVEWQESKLGADSSSPVVFGDNFYVIRRPNVLVSARIEDAEVQWKTRLKGSGFWATPLVTPEHVFLVSTDGIVQVVTHDGEMVGENELEMEILGSPAAANGAVYLRATNALIKVGEKSSS